MITNKQRQMREMSRALIAQERMRNADQRAHHWIKGEASKIRSAFDLTKTINPIEVAGMEFRLPAIDRLSCYKCYTAIDRKHISGFIVDGYWKQVWESGITWHNRYAENPLEGRRFNEQRLFGERVVSGLAHAILLPNPLGNDSRIVDYLHSFVDQPEDLVLIEWWSDVWSLGNSTFTLGDSQQNPMVWPLTWQNLRHICRCRQIQEEVPLWAMKAFTDTGRPSLMLERVLSAVAVPPRNPYFEIQIHGVLTPSEVAAYHTVADGVMVEQSLENLL